MDNVKLNKKAWEAYMDYRAENRMRKLKTGSVQKLIDWLSSYSHTTQAEIVDTTIRNGWIGLFPPKNVREVPHETRERVDNSAVGRVYRATAAVLDGESDS